MDHGINMCQRAVLSVVHTTNCGVPLSDLLSFGRCEVTKGGGERECVFQHRAMRSRLWGRTLEFQDFLMCASKRSHAREVVQALACIRNETVHSVNLLGGLILGSLNTALL